MSNAAAPESRQAHAHTSQQASTPACTREGEGGREGGWERKRDRGREGGGEGGREEAREAGRAGGWDRWRGVSNRENEGLSSRVALRFYNQSFNPSRVSATTIAARKASEERWTMMWTWPMVHSSSNRVVPMQPLKVAICSSPLCCTLHTICTRASHFLILLAIQFMCHHPRARYWA